MDQSLFFPPVGGVRQAREAKQVCAGCPVRDDCLADALTTGTSHGIWGGLSVRERRRLQASSAAPTAA